MHDWTLISVLFEWGAARVTCQFRRGGNEQVMLVAEGVTKLLMPQGNEWGPSVSVNSADGPVEVTPGLSLLKIEMQSGDTIEIEAKLFSMPN